VEVELEDIMDAVAVSKSIANPWVAQLMLAAAGHRHHCIAPGMPHAWHAAPASAAMGMHQLVHAHTCSGCVGLWWGCVTSGHYHIPRSACCTALCRYTTILRRRYWPQLTISVMIPIWQQWTGINAIM
jgi:hypothetical protein